MSFRAVFFNGKDAAAHEVRFTVEGELLTIQLDGQSLTYARSAVEVASGFDDGRSCIEFSDGARLDIADQSATQAIAHLLPFHQRIVAGMTRHLAIVIVALLLSAGGIYLALTEGVPMAAAAIAQIFPDDTEKRLGQMINGAIYEDKTLFQRSALPSERQAVIRDRLAALCRDDSHCPDYRLSFRKSMYFGANALALPGGEIIVTDDLVSMAKSNDEIIAVLAHELGHVAHKHSLRRMLESSLRALVMVGITGDVDSVASALPGLMLGLKYSRELESDADRFALEFLLRHCISPASFAAILDSLAASAQRRGGETPVSSLMATHPDSVERARAFRQARLHDCR